MLDLEEVVLGFDLAKLVQGSDLEVELGLVLGSFGFDHSDLEPVETGLGWGNQLLEPVAEMVDSRSVFAEAGSSFLVDFVLEDAVVLVPVLVDLGVDPGGLGTVLEADPGIDLVAVLGIDLEVVLGIGPEVVLGIDLAGNLGIGVVPVVPD